MSRKIVHLLIATRCFGVSSGNNAGEQIVGFSSTNLSQNFAQALSAAPKLEQIISIVNMLTASHGVSGLLGRLNQPKQHPTTNHLANQLFDNDNPASAVARAIAQDTNRQIIGKGSSADLLKVQVAGLANPAGIGANDPDRFNDRVNQNTETLRQRSASL